MDMGRRAEHTGHHVQTDLLREGAALHVIRTETVLSRLPLHNLAKKGTMRIHLTRTNARGELELYWLVSPNPAYG